MSPAIIDTSIVVRYLSGDPPAGAEVAEGVLDHVEDLVLTEVVLLETAYVLSSVYGIARDVVIDQLLALVRKQNVSLRGLDKGLALEALLLCWPSGRVSIADAMVWAAARSLGGAPVYTLDERFPSDGIKVLRSA